MPGLWRESGEGPAAAEQSAIQQALRGCRGPGVRERVGSASGAAVRFAGDTVRAIDLRYLERWAATRRKPALRQMGVDEIHLGKEAEVPDGGVQPGNE